jgi:uncharacterized membrane protein
MHVSAPGLALDPRVLGFGGVMQATNLHPLFVHFPIALLPASLILYGIAARTERRDFYLAGRATLAMAAPSILMAMMTGVRGMYTVGVVVPREPILGTHWALGMILCMLAPLLFGWSCTGRDNRPKAPRAFLATLGLTTLLAMQAADLGDRVVAVFGGQVRPNPVRTRGAGSENAPGPGARRL